MAATPSIEVFTGDGSTRGSEFSSLVTILADERSNALIVSGTVDDIHLIRELVNKIDVVLPQVRIEVVIAEVALGDNDTTGIEVLGLQIEGDRLVGLSGALAGLTITGSGDGNTTGVTRPGSVCFVSGRYDLAGIVQLSTTPRKDKTNILSAPSILTAHNTEGSIFVG